MNKQEVLSAITQLASEKKITIDEVLQAFSAKNQKKPNALFKEMTLSDVLYIIGGLVIFIGVAVLIGQNWNTLNSFTRIVVTLGFGVVLYFAGVILNKEEKYGAAGHAFQLVAALLLPVGLGVTFYEANFKVEQLEVQSLISGILLCMYIASYFVFRKTLFIFFSIMYGTWFFFSFTNFLMGSDPLFSTFKFYEYRFLLVGLTYILLGYYFSSTDHKALTGVLYGFGLLGFLGAALALGGWKPEQNVFWELIFPGLIFGVLFLSVHLKSKAFLSFGTIFLMGYIVKITGEYFSGTLGWPFSLMICGVALMAIGYYAFTLNKKYIAVS